MSEPSISKEIWSGFEDRIDKEFRDCNPTGECIYVHTPDKDIAYNKKIENIAEEFGIKNFIKIIGPSKDNMRGGYQTEIVKK